MVNKKVNNLKKIKELCIYYFYSVYVSLGIIDTDFYGIVIFTKKKFCFLFMERLDPLNLAMI